MKPTKKIITLCLCVTALACAGCKSDNKKIIYTTKPQTTVTTTQTTTTTTAPPETTTQATTTLPEPEPEPLGKFNNLTGEYTLSDEAEGKRPMAVMVNNITYSLPQYGIYGADILYECLVEGGITRLMAVYGDYTKVPDICSIRSCRYYYPMLAMGHDAVYFHYGLDKTVAKDTLDRLDTDHFDGGYYGEAFMRDKNRVGKYSTEHTIYLKGSKIPELLKNYRKRTDLLESYNKPAFNFVEENGEISGKNCTTATLNFSRSYFSTFKYDEKTKTYKKFHNGEKHMDSKANKQLEFTNVFYLETTTKIINSNNGLISVDLSGGKGYYISNGQAKEIRWKRSGDTSPILFTNTDGSELSVNKGKSYIGFSPKNTLKIK